MQYRLNKLITKLFCAQLFCKQDNVFVSWYIARKETYQEQKIMKS